MRDEQELGQGIERLPVPRWRIASGVLVLAGLAWFGAQLAPVYFRNLELQQYVDGMTQQVRNHTDSDEILRARVLQKAASLDLPVRTDNVRIDHTSQGTRIDVRYVVKVDLPLYTVDLHFHPSAGSRD